MKCLHTYIFSTVLAIVLSLMMAIPSLAASCEFQDVPETADCYESVLYLSDHGITNGTGNGFFSPDTLLTVRQWAVMLCRAYGMETTGNTWTELSENSITEVYQKGWLKESAVLKPDTKLCRSTLYESAFAAAQIPIYDSVLYENGAMLTKAENHLRIARELSLCGENDGAAELVTRGETAMLLHSILIQSFTVETPAVPVTLENAFGVDINDYLLALQQVPEPVLASFNKAGWILCIDFDYLGELSERLSMNCIGATSYGEKVIYLSDPNATLHEFGHFLAGQMGFPAEHERLYQAESQTAALRAYAKTNAREYFADCFAYWVMSSDSPHRMELFRNTAPQTCAYMERLEENGWRHRP